MDDPLGAVRSQNAAVLFADIRSFTPIAEALAPEATIALLREFHRRMAAQVFACGGTLDKYMGDGLMATFGTPHATPDDAANALRCARGMIETIDDWNRARREAGAAEIRIGVGVHYGPVVLGDIGDERRLEFAVIGDTVNAASRLEGLTKNHRVPVLVSADLVEAAGGDSGPSAAETPLRAIGEIRVRGRAAPLTLYALG